MTDDIAIFNTENMLSTLGVVVEDDFIIHFVREDFWNAATSVFSIDSKINNNFFLLVNNFERESSITSDIEMDIYLRPDGTLIPYFPMNNPKIKSAIELVNQYIKVFMAIYTVDSFNDQDYIKLTINIEYSNDNKLSIVQVNATTELFKHYNWYHGVIEITLESYINTLLNEIGIDCLYLTTNIDPVIELLKMQDLITEMDCI